MAGQLSVYVSFPSPLFLNPSNNFAGCKQFAVMPSEEPTVWVRQEQENADGQRETLPASDDYKFTPAQLAEAVEAYEDKNKVFIRIPVKEFEDGRTNVEKRVNKETNKEFFSISGPYNQPEGAYTRGMGWTAPSARGPKTVDGVECYTAFSLKGADIPLSKGQGDDRTTEWVDATALSKAFQADFDHAAREAAHKAAPQAEKEAPAAEVAAPVQEAPAIETHDQVR